MLRFSPQFCPSDHSWNVVNHNLKFEHLTQKNRLKRRFFKERWSECRDSNPGPPAPKAGALPTAQHPVMKLGDPVGRIHPNLSGKLFMLVYSGFQCFLICFTYSLTLLSPLCPHVPAPSVVIYVVKNASRPVFGENSPMPDGKRFSLLLAAL